MAVSLLNKLLLTSSSQAKIGKKSDDLWLFTASSTKKPSAFSKLPPGDWHSAPSLPSTGEGDEDDVCLGVMSWPGGAEPQRSLETLGHLRLQHWAGPLEGGGGGGGGGTKVKRSIPDKQTVMKDRRCKDVLETPAHTHSHVYKYINIWGQSVSMLPCHARDCICTHSHFWWRPRGFMCTCTYIYSSTLKCTNVYGQRDELPTYYKSIANGTSTNVCVCSLLHWIAQCLGYQAKCDYRTFTFILNGLIQLFHQLTQRQECAISPSALSNSTVHPYQRGGFQNNGGKKRTLCLWLYPVVLRLKQYLSPTLSLSKSVNK